MIDIHSQSTVFRSFKKKCINFNGLVFGEFLWDICDRKSISAINSREKKTQ